ncbi:MAG: S49 family peptidase [Bacteroidota bacterium]
MRRIIHSNYKNFFTSKLFMTSEAANGFVAEVVEFYLRAKNRSESDEDEPIFLLASDKLASQLSSESITLTTKFSETDIPDDSIALHRIHGTLFADYDDWGWYFSTKQLVDDLMAAEANPKILSHFFHVNSGGGEAWYLDIAASAIQGVKKPVVAYAESVMASAAYYLGMNADRIYAGTKFDIIGSIGTMT